MMEGSSLTRKIPMGCSVEAIHSVEMDSQEGKKAAGLRPEEVEKRELAEMNRPEVAEERSPE